MSCESCKKKGLVKKLDNNKEEIKSKSSIKDYILKGLLFLILTPILLLPVIVIYLIFSFKIIFLSQHVDLMPLVHGIAKIIFKEDEIDDSDEIDEDNYEIYDNDIVVLK